MSRWRNHTRLALTAGFLLAFGLALAVLHRPILRAIGGWLVAEDSVPARADLIFLLNGGMNTRPFRAAELFAQGVAPRITIAQSERLPTERLGLTRNSTDVSIGVLKQLGVPASAITVLPFESGTASTYDEARALRSYLEAAPALRVIAVTSDYHTRRTRIAVRHEVGARGVQVWMVASPEAFGPHNWWQSEAGFLAYLEEYLKIFHSALLRR